MTASTSLQEAVNRQRRAIAAVRGGEVQVPPELRARTALAQEQTARSPRLSAPVAIAAAVLVIGVFAAVALSLPGDIAPGATIVQAARLGSRPATLPPPDQDPQRPALLTDPAGGLAFPDFQATFGWVPAGRRLDRLGDRQVATVFYQRGDRRLAYSIVLGPRLPPPVATTDEVRQGVRIRLFLAHDRAVLTFVRRGRTCLISEARPEAGTDPEVDAEELFTLAGWRGKRQVRF